MKSWTQLSNFTFTFHFSLSCIGEGIGKPLKCSCLENPRDEGVWWWAAVHGVALSQTRLKWLSSSSSSNSSCFYFVAFNIHCISLTFAALSSVSVWTSLGFLLGTLWILALDSCFFFQFGELEIFSYSFFKRSLYSFLPFCSFWDS